MAVLTLGQLSKSLATQNPSNQSTFFLEPGGVFVNYVNELGPRIYAMGMWRELLVERSYSGADGYISIERDVESVIHANVNNRPQRVQALFHDKRFLGCTNFMPENFGLVDLGMATSQRDILTIQGETSLETVADITEFAVCNAAGAKVPFATLDAAGTTLALSGFTSASVNVTGGMLSADGNGDAVAAFAGAHLDQCVATGVPFTLQLRTDAADAATTVTTIFPGTDVPRFRRFRVGGAQSDTFVHIIGKRAWTDLSLPNDIVWLGNISAWKHALLCKVAEDTADVERAEYHWSKVRQILDDELAQFQGAARPVPTLDLNSGSLPLHNLY